jgi:hypothetical protein
LGETQEISVKPRNGSALALEKLLFIERNEREYWKYTLNAAAEMVLDKTGPDRKTRLKSR